MSVPDTLAASGGREPDGPGAEPARDSGLIARLGRWWERERPPGEAEIGRLFSARLTDVAANRLAREWCEAYRTGDGKARRAMLSALAAVGAGLEPRGDQGTRLFRRLNAQPGGLRFLVDLRADMLRWRKQVAGLQALERELEGLLSNWFDVGMLELKRLTWDSPASLLEKLIIYEAVHEITSWEDLRHRVAEDRRCYAFFHPRMPDVPLIFVEAAFAQAMAADVQSLLDPSAPRTDLGKARCAVFYSISNTQPGLRGISFGNFLLKRVIEQLLLELPRLKSFATLSPVPGFAEWLARQDGEAVAAIVHDGGRGSRTRHAAAAGARWLARLRAAARSRTGSQAGQRAGLRLLAHYLQIVRGGQPQDPVARFHLGNGARIERLNWAADLSPKGLEQSCGMMVNYLYVLDELDANLASLAEGKPRLGRPFGRVG